MTPSEHDRDDAQLSAWLREASGEPLLEISSHVTTVRQILLEQLEPQTASQPARPDSLRSRTRGRRKWTVVALATSSVAAALAVSLLLSSRPAPLSAMELAVQRLQEVTSYRYRLQWQTRWREDDGKRELISQGNGMTYWQAPSAFHNVMKIIKVTQDVPAGNRREKVLEDFAEIFPADGPGLLIDYLRKTYVRIPFDPTGSRTYPWDVLRMIREQSYTVQRDLGVKQVDGVQAHGYVLELKAPRPGTVVRDPVELWVDLRTNLPLEFSYGGSNAGSTYTDRATDFRWNVALDDKLFAAVPPAGFAEITPPSAEHDRQQIAAALRLYARLSQGHYPQTENFRAAAIHEEMLRLAGFSGAARPEWSRDETYQQIQEATTGLNWIERILRNRFVSGYRGTKVRPADKQQVLLWWLAPPGARYRVFYGDLRSELIDETRWSPLVPESAGPNGDGE